MHISTKEYRDLISPSTLYDLVTAKNSKSLFLKYFSATPPVRVQAEVWPCISASCPSCRDAEAITKHYSHG